jgi:hypothetical protein
VADSLNVYFPIVGSFELEASVLSI